jgi:hypothetical protein
MQVNLKMQQFQLFCKNMLIQREYSSSYVINKPVNSLKQILSCNSTAPYNLPMMCLDWF